jgi:hypothetical protein
VSPRHVLLAALTTVAVSPAFTGPARAASPARPVAVTINARRPGPAIPANFLGLSFEDKSIPTLESLSGAGNLVPLLRGLGAGVLRLGGVTADTQVAWLGLDPAMPPWATVGLTPQDLVGLAALSETSGWPVLLTLNLGHVDAQSAADEAQAASDALGPNLLAVALGNEPDAFVLDGLRPQPWGFPQFQLDTDAYRAALPNAVPLAGPDVSSGVGELSWVEQESAIEHPVLLTAHFYPLSWCHGYLPALADLLSTHMHRLERRTLADEAFITNAYDVPLRLDETNNISCGGEPGVSNTFGAALWAADFLSRAMGAGIAGINFHDIPQTAQGYSPILAASPAALAAGQLTAAPEYYAMLLARQLEGGRPLPVTIRPGGLDVQALATRMPTGGEQVLLIDEEAAPAPPLRVHFAVPAHSRRALVMRLLAPSLDATDGVTLGGSAVAPDGTWAPVSLPRVPIAKGRATVTLAPDSAALVTVAAP